MTWIVVLAVVAFLAGTAKALDEYLAAKTWPWIHADGLHFALLILLSAMTLADSLKRAIHRLRAQSTTRKRVRIRNQLSQLIVTLSEVTGRPISDFGCGLFQVQGRGIRRKQRLVRRERVRLVDDVHESPVNFTYGKGTVGECWERCSTAYFNWCRINKKWGGKTIARDDWEGMATDKHRNFTLPEFQSLVGKYSEVLAVPITVNGSFAGCIAVDLKWHKDAAPTGPVLEKANVRTPVNAAARTIVPTLELE